MLYEVITVGEHRATVSTRAVQFTTAHTVTHPILLNVVGSLASPMSSCESAAGSPPGPDRRAPHEPTSQNQSRRREEPLVGLFELLRQLFDVLRRPVRNVHAEVQTHRGEHFLDLVQGLAAEVRGAEHLGLGP